jgi:hypothetical protein
MVRSWATFCLVLLSGAVTNAQSRIVDPFFGIKFDPSKAHFENMPLLLKNQCSEIRAHYAKAWVLAHLKTVDAEYFILYGYIKVPSEKHPGTFSVELEEDDGLIVALQGSTCRVDQWQFFFRKELNPATNATPVRASEEVMNEIAADLFERYAKAFGGKEPFLKHVTKDNIEELPPFLQKRLEAFEKQRQ